MKMLPPTFNKESGEWEVRLDNNLYSFDREVDASQFWNIQAILIDDGDFIEVGNTQFTQE